MSGLRLVGRCVLAVLVVAGFLYAQSRDRGGSAEGPYGVQIADGQEVEPEPISVLDALAKAVGIGLAAFVMWVIVFAGRPNPEDEYRRGFHEGCGRGPAFPSEDLGRCVSASVLAAPAPGPPSVPPPGANGRRVIAGGEVARALSLHDSLKD